jgi:OPA family glycerol-3-phosphate transporter-like MFS transporter
MSRDLPVQHSNAYRIRRFLNWFPMGLTYAFLYMARYNLTVSKNALSDVGNLMSNEDFGIIFAVGTVTYALAFLINGPLTDRIGGKKAILIGALGAAVMNTMMGLTIHHMLVAQNPAAFNLRLVFSFLYAGNMYFQSYGAVAIVKVNASWFHVRERGVFGGIFGVLISLGLYFAFDWGLMISEATKATVTTHLNAIQHVLRSLVGANSAAIDETWWVFYVPAAILAAFFVVELFLLRDKPSQAGFQDFDTGDASSGEEDVPYHLGYLLKRILTNKIILTVAVIEFCSGIMRNGIMHWYVIYIKEALHYNNDQFMLAHWGLILMLAGVFGGIFAGFVSDKVFGSRRGPVAGLLYGFMLAGTIAMVFSLQAPWYVLGFIVAFMSLCVIGVHGMLSGTATMDFGGTKAAATAVGLIDGCVYLGTGFQSFCLGFITTWNWNFWPVFLLPFATLGLFLAIRIWKAYPQARQKAQA